MLHLSWRSRQKADLLSLTLIVLIPQVTYFHLQSASLLSPPTVAQPRVVPSLHLIHPEGGTPLDLCTFTWTRLWPQLLLCPCRGPCMNGLGDYQNKSGNSAPCRSCSDNVDLCCSKRSRCPFHPAYGCERICRRLSFLFLCPSFPYPWICFPKSPFLSPENLPSSEILTSACIPLPLKPPHRGGRKEIPFLSCGVFHSFFQCCDHGGTFVHRLRGKLANLVLVGKHQLEGGP